MRGVCGTPDRLGIDSIQPLWHLSVKDIPVIVVVLGSHEVKQVEVCKMATKKKRGRPVERPLPEPVEVPMMSWFRPSCGCPIRLSGVIWSGKKPVKK